MNFFNFSSIFRNQVFAFIIYLIVTNCLLLVLFLQVFLGYVVGTIGIASIGEHYGMWEWLKPLFVPYRSIKAIAAKERSEENEARRALYPLGGREEKVEALIQGDINKVIGEILPVGKELIKSVQEKVRKIMIKIT